MTPVHVINESVGELRIGHGVAGVAETALSAIEWPLRKYIIIRAAAGNTNTVIVGRPNDAANGWVLEAGESTPPIPVDNTKHLAVIGGAAAQDYNWLSL